MPLSFYNKLEKIKVLLSQISQIDNLLFKGGTSLSLTYNVTKRFSEDVDLSFIFNPNESNSVNQKKLDKIHKQLEGILETHYKGQWQTKNNDYIITITNEAPVNDFEHIIKRNEIKLEVPREFKKVEYTYSKRQPFKDADFEMNVMDLKAIFWDKTFLIYEKFITHNFEWVFDKETNGRHLYDLQKLLENFNYKDISDTLYNQRIKNEILSGDVEGFIRGKLEKGLNRKAHLNQSAKKTWILFEAELKIIAQKLEELIKKIIYPNSSAFNVAKILKGYEPIFKHIHTLTKQHLLFLIREK